MNPEPHEEAVAVPRPLPSAPPVKPANVPFFRPSLGAAELEAVLETMRSGWLTTGPNVRRFEAAFARQAGASHAIAVNSCTAALHLAVEALGLGPGDAVLVPTMTFAATAEVVRYCGAVPVLVDCDPATLNMDLDDAERKLAALQSGRLAGGRVGGLDAVGVMPVHVAGMMMDTDAVRDLAERHRLWVVEDAAHAFPAARRRADGSWQRCGEGTADVTCFSFYANKTITTGEGGMAVSEDPRLAERIRLMSLHGLSQDAWQRYSGGKSWDYRIVAPGYKYNLTDLAAAIGLCQLERAEAMRAEREAIAERYFSDLAEVDEVELPPDGAGRIHSWHLFFIRLHLDRLRVDRAAFVDALRERGVGCSVHWRPLHLHPYYQETFGWRPDELPVASREWERTISLPIFAGMRDDEADHVVATIAELCREHRR